MDFHGEPKGMKLLEGNIRENLCGLGLREDFSEASPTRPTMNRGVDWTWPIQRVATAIAWQVRKAGLKMLHAEMYLCTLLEKPKLREREPRGTGGDWGAAGLTLGCGVM